jgi:D-glycero-D-manno-heptose 1,7-bisphosphate phosphatase
VFLDRDGVLNAAHVRDGVPHPPASVDEVRLLPGVPDALRRLAEASYLLIVVTNQPDVARGLQRREVVEAINDQIRSRLRLDGVYTCYHDGEACGCRKPKPGLLFEAAAQHLVDLQRSFMVGDRWSDVAAGQAAGCRSLLIRNDYSQAERCVPDAEVGDLPQAATWILER